MFRPVRSVVLALLLVLSFVPFIASGASAASNSVTIAIEGGDANALALCLNAVKNGDRVFQANHCRNTAIAAGGSVILKNVDITVVQTNDSDGNVSNDSNTVDLTIRGGDANALAACLNAVKNGDKVFQKNNCKNKAIAQGGDVVLKNVSILIIQDNL